LSIGIARSKRIESAHFAKINKRVGSRQQSVKNVAKGARGGTFDVVVAVRQAGVAEGGVEVPNGRGEGGGVKRDVREEVEPVFHED
jgi:hypothetical protein